MTLFLLIGLGNPGRDYAGNRHNIGFMAVDRIAADYGFSRAAQKFGGALSEGVISGRKIYAFKPLGYMNTSGIPAAEAARFYKIPPEQVIVIHDELDLPLGKLRVKKGGGHGGHNGLKSLDAHIGKDYWRVRLGIGHPSSPSGLRRDESRLAVPKHEVRRQVTGHVLGDFSKAEMPLVDAMLTEVSRHIGLLLQGDEAGFMNKVALAQQTSI